MAVDRRTFMRHGAVVGAGALAACASTELVEQASDPMFNQPYIDIDEWRDAPARHRYVHGGFRGTEARFVFYMPPAEQYQGRFFQYILPVPAPEDRVFSEFGNTNPLGFAFNSGAIAVGSNQGGAAATARMGSGIDPTIAAYRVSAAAANYARVVASEMYGQHRTYGYCYGGSGGAFRTIGCVENTSTWDGSVVFVMGSPMALPNVYTVRCQALRVLRGKFPQIIDAIEPGGSGDPYAGLNAEEHTALSEMLRLGFPVRSLAFAERMGIGALAVLFDQCRAADPGYFTDFWTLPGYLGFDQPQSLAQARVRHRSVVTRVIMSNEAASFGLSPPGLGGAISASADQAWQMMQRFVGDGAPFVAALQVREAPPTRGDYGRAALHIHSGSQVGQQLACSGVDRDFLMLHSSPIGGNQGAPAQTAIAVGDEIELDNSDYLALQSYHRHQAPGPDYPQWDQFRNPDGSPKYPQRPRLLGPSFQQNAGGSLPSARYHGKMIVVETMMDYDAFPWQADWYRKKVEANFGARANDRFRLWMVDHAVHGGPSTARTISYDTVLQQALRDVAAWAERGIAPPPTTNYRVDDGQIIVPANAAERLGAQPVVALTANGAARADVRAGQAVTFAATAEAPPNTGSIVAAEWDLEGAGGFEDIDQVTPAPRVTLSKSHTFARAGAYFVGLRVASQRQGDPSTPHARLLNIARVRVVVT